jgi:hypothetical protein
MPGATAPRQQMRRRRVCSMHGAPEKHGELGEVDDIAALIAANLGDQLGGARIVDRPCRQLQRQRMQPAGRSTPIGRAQLDDTGGLHVARCNVARCVLDDSAQRGAP